jgi:hypothetical protein
MARKKKIGLYDIGRVPVTEVGNKSGYENNKELSARLRREEAEELAKKRQAIEDADPTRQAERAYVDAMTKVAIETRDRLRKLYRDVSTVNDYLKHDIDGLSDDIGLPTTTHPVSMDDAGARVKAFADGLPAGTFTSAEARSKFHCYVYVAAFNHTVIDNSTLQAMLERCESLGIGVTLPKAQRPVTPEPTPTVVDIEGMDTNTRENRAAVRDLVARLAAEEQVPLRDEWLYESLPKEFNFYITQEQWVWCWHIPNPRNPQDMGGWFQRNNKSPLDPRSYDECRRAAVANRIFPDRLLREDERLARDVEQSDIQDYTTRRDLNRRIVEQRGSKVLG